MSYSCADFTEDVFEVLMTHGIIKREDLTDDDNALPDNAEKALSALVKALSRPKVVAIVEGGVLQSAVADREIYFGLIDYDVQGCDDDNMKWVPQRDGPDETGTITSYSEGSGDQSPGVLVSPERAAELLAVLDGPSIADDPRTKDIRGD